MPTYVSSFREDMQRLGCCRRDKGISLDMEDERSMVKLGMVDGVFKRWSLDSGSTITRLDGFCTDSLSVEEDDSSCSSSRDGFGSFSTRWSMRRQHDFQIREDLLDIPSPLHCKSEPEKKEKQCEDGNLMKERFAKLLLGEDMSGGSKGVSTALALSNAITNLSASVFGELWRLEPLAHEKKSKWVREMDWLLAPANYMVELVPSRQSYSNGKTIEIMTPRPRSDIHINLPALRKLDAMLIESLDGIEQKEFWYIEGGSTAADDLIISKRTQGKKWWLPVPRVPETGLSDDARKKLLYQRDSIAQIFKAAKSINEQVLSEMDIPDLYWDTLPKTGKASLGETLYKFITTENATVESVLSLLDLSSEHNVLEMANRLEAAIYSWKKRIQPRHNISLEDGKSAYKSSWSLVKESEAELWKKEGYIERAENILLHIKNKYPSMPQTFLDITKIQYNRDVGHSILESYSRVLESLAFNILSRIHDVLNQDDIAKAAKKGPPPPTTSFSTPQAQDFESVRPSSVMFPSMRKSISWSLECCGLPSASPSSPSSPTPESHLNSEPDTTKLGVLVGEALFSYLKRESCYSESEYKDACEDISSTSGRKSSAAVSPRLINSWCYGRDSCRSISCTNSP